MASKDKIIAEIRRLAAEQGAPPGRRTFADATGIRIAEWRGKFRRNWSAALVEAGFPPNLPKAAHEVDAHILALVELTRALGHFPTYADLRLARSQDDTFPTHQAFAKRLGGQEERIVWVRESVRYRSLPWPARSRAPGYVLQTIRGRHAGSSRSSTCVFSSVKPAARMAAWA